MLRAASRGSLAQLRDELREDFDAMEPSALPPLADQLFAVTGLLVEQTQLRRTLSDHSTDPARRAELATTVFGSSLSDAAMGVVRQAAQLRWSNPWDFADAIEIAGIDALFAAADRAGVLDDVEDELFRFQRILGDASDLSSLLDELSEPAEPRVRLLSQVVHGKVHPLTEALLSQAVRGERKRAVVLAIDDYLNDAAALRERSVAKVLSAVELSDAQQQRLARSLSDMYGRPISVRTAVEPAVRGGLVVRVGDEVIDGSVASRLAQARTVFIGRNG